MILRTLAALLVAATTALAVGCAPPGDVGTNVEDASESEDAAVAFEVLDVRKSAADAGLTVIKSKAAFREFFQQEPPAGLHFNKSWVLHYSMGVQSTGGYGTEITAIEKEGSGQDRTLVVQVTDTSPGYGCFVTQALTNPQVAVAIHKHPGADVELAVEQVAVNCEDPNEAFCPRVRCAKGFRCDEEQDACVPGPCDPAGDDCAPGYACENHVACITAPCFEEWLCWPSEPKPEDPCGGLTLDGLCEGDTVRWCEDELQESIDCAAYGMSCGVDDSGFADCR